MSCDFYERNQKKMSLHGPFHLNFLKKCLLSFQTNCLVPDCLFIAMLWNSNSRFSEKKNLRRPDISVQFFKDLTVDWWTTIAYERHEKKNWGGTLIAKVIIWKSCREASPVEQFTIDCDHLDYLNFITKFFWRIFLVFSASFCAF